MNSVRITPGALPPLRLQGAGWAWAFALPASSQLWVLLLGHALRTSAFKGHTRWP